MNFNEWLCQNKYRNVPVSYMAAEIETLASSEANYYFIRHPEKTYSVELWSNIKAWIFHAVCIDENECPYIDINVVDDCIDEGLKQLELLKESEEHSISCEDFFRLFNGDTNDE